jgi:hypothetical protein
MEDVHIADGIAARLLLAGIVLAGGAVGALGLAPASSQVAASGAVEDPFTAAFPIDNATLGGSSYQLSLDGKGNDPYLTEFSTDAVTAAFPIDNFSAVQVSAGTPSDVATVIHDVELYALGLGQDMDPYSLGLGQDMDPY